MSRGKLKEKRQRENKKIGRGKRKKKERGIHENEKGENRIERKGNTSKIKKRKTGEN